VPNSGSTPGVSVIVCARNEEKHVAACLKGLAEQRYENFEIILVDDGSADSTPKILEAFEKEFNSDERPVRILRISPEDSKGKKNALSRGIQMAVKENILLTDADCIPNSDEWILRMSSHFDKNFEIVLGYGAYRKIHGSMLNKLIRFETLMTAMQYFSYALKGNPYMGVGRNLAYQKSLFEKTKGFDAHINVPSGDDDLFVCAAATSENTNICDHPLAFTVSEPEHHFSSWIRQKRRHITTAHHYKKVQKIMLGSFYVSQLGFYAMAVALLILDIAPIAVVSLILLRFTFFYTAIYGASKKLKEKDLSPLAPLYEISIIFMQLYVFVANLLSPPKQW
jgi:glycosyltransferase involved in cell wall biosynthesis